MHSYIIELLYSLNFIVDNMILVWHKFTAMIVWSNSYAYIHG